MAESYQTFSGAATPYAFTKPYLSTSHLSVEVDGVPYTGTATVTPTPASPPFTSASVALSPDAAGGTSVKILRNTPVPSGALYKDFTDGGVLKASDLDDIQRYHGYKAQEEEEQARKPVAAADVGLTVQGLTGQTGDLQQWVDVNGVVKAKIDAAGDYTGDINFVNAAVSGTLGVTGATTLTGGVAGPMAATGAVSGTTGTFTGAVGITGATTLTGGVTGAMAATGAVSGTTGTFSGNVAVNTDKFTVASATGNTAVAGNLNLVAGALQYAGVNALSIRQIVAAAFTGTTTTNITDEIDYRKTGISFSITPKVSTSYLLFLWSTRVNATDDAGSGTNAGWEQTLYKDPTGSPDEGDALAGGTPLPANAQVYAFTGASADPVKYNTAGPFMYMHAPGSTSAAEYVYGVRTFSGGDDVTVVAHTNYGWGYVIEIG